VKSNTLDVKVPAGAAGNAYLEPSALLRPVPGGLLHLGLIDGAPVPAFASADYRLGAEERDAGRDLRLSGSRAPPASGRSGASTSGSSGTATAGAVGAQQQFDLFPAVNIGTATVTYSLGF